MSVPNQSHYESLNSSFRKKQWMLNLLSVVIAKRPQRIRKLLRRHGINTSHQINRRALFRKVIAATHSRGTDFQLELAMLLSQQQHLEDDYAGLILGAVSGVASAVGNIKSKKQRRAEASQETLANIMQARAYQAQQMQQVQQAQIAAQNAARKAAQQTAKKQADAKRMRLVIAIGGIGFASLALLFFYQKTQVVNQG